MNLLLRFLSALVLLPVVVFAVLSGQIEWYGLLFLAFAATVYEYGSLIGIFGFKERVAMALGLPLWMLGCVLCQNPFPFFIAGLGFLTFVFGAHFVFHAKLPRSDFEKMGALLWGLMYIGAGFTSVALIRERAGSSLVFLLLTVVWSSDTVAYFAGRCFGKHKLHASVSEKKTWEGFIGGALGTLCMPFVIPMLFPALEWTTQEIFWVALPAIFVAPLGDLIESRLKRFYGVKDSGTILPGHGGLWDRVDALLVMAPFVLAYAFFIQPL